MSKGGGESFYLEMGKMDPYLVFRYQPLCPPFNFFLFGLSLPLGHSCPTVWKAYSEGTTASELTAADPKNKTLGKFSLSCSTALVKQTTHFLLEIRKASAYLQKMWFLLLATEEDWLKRSWFQRRAELLMRSFHVVMGDCVVNGRCGCEKSRVCASYRMNHRWSSLVYVADVFIKLFGFYLVAPCGL